MNWQSKEHPIRVPISCQIALQKTSFRDTVANSVAHRISLVPRPITVITTGAVFADISFYLYSKIVQYCWIALAFSYNALF